MDASGYFYFILQSQHSLDALKVEVHSIHVPNADIFLMYRQTCNV